MSSRTLPRIAVTMGDPAGIGPEICLHLLNDASLANVCVPVVFGDAGVLQRVAGKLQISFNAPVVFDPRAAQGPGVLDLHAVDAATVVPGRIDARCGDAAFRYVVAAIDAGLAGSIDAVATGPLNKEALHAAGHKYPGHTEIFAERMKAARSCMMLTSPELTCSFVTVHVGYHEVPGLLSVRRILDDEQIVSPRERQNRVHLARMSIEMHGHDGARPRRDGALDRRGVDATRR